MGVRSRRSRRPSSLFRLSSPLGQMGQTHAGCGGAGRNATCHVSTTLTHIFEQRRRKLDWSQCNQARAYFDGDGLRNPSPIQNERMATNQSIKSQKSLQKSVKSCFYSTKK